MAWRPTGVGGGEMNATVFLGWSLLLLRPAESCCPASAIDAVPSEPSSSTSDSAPRPYALSCDRWGVICSGVAAAISGKGLVLEPDEDERAGTGATGGHSGSLPSAGFSRTIGLLSFFSPLLRPVNLLKSARIWPAVVDEGGG